MAAQAKRTCTFLCKWDNARYTLSFVSVVHVLHVIIAAVILS